MASLVGTATDLEDLVSDIITFLTTDTDLVADSEEWTVLRQRRDKLAGVTTNLTEQASQSARKVIHSFRYDTRSINTDSTSNNQGYTDCSGWSVGVSFIRMQLRTATEIDNVQIRSCASDASALALSEQLGNFKLQWSDDDSAWTTALTVASNPTYTYNEIKEFAVPGTPGAHVYWRIIIDSINAGSTSGSSVTWRSILLRESDGTIANHFGSEVYFQAPGLSGTDEIYTGIRSEYDAASGWYNLFLNGYTGFDSGELDFFEQAGGLPGHGSAVSMETPMIPCWNSSMPYWFAASGRSFRMAVKVSTSFESGYLGFLLPYATPVQYPYPLVIAGSLLPVVSARTTEWRYSYNSYRHSSMSCPANDGTGNLQDGGTLYIRTPDSTWRQVGQRATSSDPNTITRTTITDTFPYTVSGAYLAVWPSCVHSTTEAQASLAYREALGGGYVMRPLIIIQRFPSSAVWGELEGVYSISGFSNASENTTTLGGITHVILQNIARTEVHEYWALALT